MYRVMGGGNAVPRQEILGERLAPFQPRGRGAGSEHAMPSGLERVHQTCHQRSFRTDHGDRHAFAFHQRQQAGDVAGGDIDIAASGFPRGAGVTRRDQHFAGARRLRQLPGKRMLAAAGTDDEDFHGLLHTGVNA